MQGNAIDDKPRCAHCGDAIGAYEPMIVLVGGEARKTSRIAERGRDWQLSECYHHACYTQAHD